MSANALAAQPAAATQLAHVVKGAGGKQLALTLLKALAVGAACGIGLGAALSVVSWAPSWLTRSPASAASQNAALPLAPVTLPGARSADVSRPRLAPAPSPPLLETQRTPQPPVLPPIPEAALQPAPPALPSAASFTAPSAPSASPPLEPESIAEQIRTLESARALLQQGNAQAALTALDGYRARWPSGTLLPEATVLAVRAKLLQGDRTAAARLAQPIIESNPGGRYAAQLRHLLAP